MQGDKTIEPTTANYTFKHILEVQNSVYEIDLCPSQLKGVSPPAVRKDPELTCVRLWFLVKSTDRSSPCMPVGPAAFSPVLLVSTVGCSCMSLKVLQYRPLSNGAQGLWRVAIYNPMRMYQVGYNLTALKIAHCLNECSGHGQCDHTGTCHCDPNWAGGDCSVNKDGDCQVAALPPPTISACAPAPSCLLVVHSYTVAAVHHFLVC